MKLRSFLFQVRLSLLKQNELKLRFTAFRRFFVRNFERIRVALFDRAEFYPIVIGTGHDRNWIVTMKTFRKLGKYPFSYKALNFWIIVLILGFSEIESKCFAQKSL